MKFEDFVDAIIKAGWVGFNDAQHHNLEKLWRKLFPVVAELEEKMKRLEADLETLEQENP